MTRASLAVAAAGHGDPYPAGAADAPADLRAAAAMPPWRRSEFLRSRALLRLLTELLTGQAGARAAFGADQAGRPVFLGHPEIGISLSHTRGAVAAAAGRGLQVGIDVQAPVDPGPGMIARCCQDADAQVLAGLGLLPRARGFAAIWAAQEACVKAVGTGLAGAPWRIPVHLGQRSGSWQDVRWWLLPDVGGSSLAVAAHSPGGRCPQPPGVLLLGPLPAGRGPGRGTSR